MAVGEGHCHGSQMAVKWQWQSDAAWSRTATNVTYSASLTTSQPAMIATAIKPQAMSNASSPTRIAPTTLTAYRFTRCRVFCSGMLTANPVRALSAAGLN